MGILKLVFGQPISEPKGQLTHLLHTLSCRKAYLQVSAGVSGCDVTVMASCSADLSTSGWPAHFFGALHELLQPAPAHYTTVCSTSCISTGGGAYSASEEGKCAGDPLPSTVCCTSCISTGGGAYSASED